MKKEVQARDFAIVVVVALIWTLIVIGFSTGMGTRPLRMYDWSPPVIACLLTLFFMLKDKSSGKQRL